MKFEPRLFIEIALRNGITLTRIEGNIKIENASDEWIAAIKQHKQQLVRLLPEQSETRLQLDLFTDMDKFVK